MKVNIGVVTKDINEREVNACAASIVLSCRARAMIAYTTKVAIGAMPAGELAVYRDDIQLDR